MRVSLNLMMLSWSAPLERKSSSKSQQTLSPKTRLRKHILVFSLSCQKSTSKADCACALEENSKLLISNASNAVKVFSRSKIIKHHAKNVQRMQYARRATISHSIQAIGEIRLTPSVSMSATIKMLVKVPTCQVVLLDILATYATHVDSIMALGTLESQIMNVLNA